MAEVFDEYASSYERHIAQAMGPMGARHETFLKIKAELILAVTARQLGSPADLSLLEVGCGTGAMATLLAPRIKSLHGVDISSRIVEVARTRVPSATFTHYTPPRLPCEDASFDVVHATCVFHHVPVNERATLMAEMHRCLKPAGLAFILEHNPLNPLTQLVVKRCEFDADAVLLTGSQSRRLMRDAGFSIVTTRYCSWLPSVAKWAQWVEAALGPIPFGAQFAVVGRKESNA